MMINSPLLMCFTLESYEILLRKFLVFCFYKWDLNIQKLIKKLLLGTFDEWFNEKRWI